MRSEVVQEFLVFARHLNFSKAARELHITQPNLSKHMMDLEREIGVTLIDRKSFGKNHPVLTDAGKYFFEEMSYLSSSLQNTLKRCQAIGQAGLTDVRVLELWQNNAMIKLYSLAGAYQTAHPERSVSYVRLSQKRPVEALLANEFDVVFDVWCGPRNQRLRQLSEMGIRVAHFLTEPPCIWFQKGNRHLEGKGALRLEDLLDIPVIMTRGGSLDYMVASYADYCERANLTPRLRHLQPQDNSPTGMFMADFHDGVLMTTPAMMHDPRLRSRTDLQCIEIDDRRIAVAFLLAIRANDAAAADFMNYVFAHKNERTA